eukprot:4039039-Prymnesium_polylepis.1
MGGAAGDAATGGEAVIAIVVDGGSIRAATGASGATTATGGGSIDSGIAFLNCFLIRSSGRSSMPHALFSLFSSKPLLCSSCLSTSPCADA